LENLTEEMEEAGQVRAAHDSARHCFARTPPVSCIGLALIETCVLRARQSTLYDDYRFVTRPELERLGLTSAIGTSVLRAYMHGARRAAAAACCVAVDGCRGVVARACFGRG
jgi:hypothetical protein